MIIVILMIIGSLFLFGVFTTPKEKINNQIERDIDFGSKLSLFIRKRLKTANIIVPSYNDYTVELFGLSTVLSLENRTILAERNLSDLLDKFIKKHTHHFFNENINEHVLMAHNPEAPIELIKELMSNIAFLRNSPNAFYSYVKMQLGSFLAQQNKLLYFYMNNMKPLDDHVSGILPVDIITVLLGYPNEIYNKEQYKETIGKRIIIEASNLEYMNLAISLKQHFDLINKLR